MSDPNPFQPPAADSSLADPPKPAYVTRLEDAAPGRLILVDTKGRTNTRRLRVAAFVIRHRRLVFFVFFTSVIVLTYLVTTVFGHPPAARPRAPVAPVTGDVWLVILEQMWPTVAILGGWMVLLFALRFPRKLTALLAAERFDEAEEPLRRLAENPLKFGRARGLARYNLAIVASWRGQPEEMLREVVLARAKLPARHVYGQLAAYAHVEALVRLGRLDEAAALLATIPPPVGEYLLAPRAVETLLIQFRRGVLETDDATLESWTALARRLPRATALNALLAWAHLFRGRKALSDELVGRAREQLRARPSLARMLPELVSWLTAQA